MSGNGNGNGTGQPSGLEWEEGKLVSDTQETVRKTGTRSATVTERRLLFEGDGVYVELRMPADAGEREEGAWLYGQFVVPDTKAEKYDLPMLAVLQNDLGVTGAMRMTDAGEFALPFRGHGDHMLEFEPREEERGHGFRVTFGT